MNNKIKIALLLMIALGNQLFSSAAGGGGGGAAAAAGVKVYKNLSETERVWTLAQEGRVDELRSLLDKYQRQGFNFKLSPNCVKAGKSPLMIAVINDHVQVVELLLDRGARLDAVDTEGRTALVLAAQYGSFEVVQFLIERGADADAVDDLKRTTLMLAAQGGHVKVVQFLMDRVVDVNAVSKIGCKAFMLAAQGGHVEVAKLLLDKGVHVSTNDFLVTSYYGLVDVMQLLLERGMNVNAVDEKGTTALMVAAKERHTKIIRLLLKQGADINAADRDGNKASRTPLIFAVAHCAIECVRLQLERGADVNVVGKYGCTALISAAYNGYVNIVKLLLERGAAVNAVDEDGKTALMYAADQGHVEIVQLIQKKIYSLAGESGGGRADAPVSVAEAAAALDQSNNQGGGADADDAQPAAEISGDFITRFTVLTDPSNIIEAFSGWLSDNFTLNGEALQLLDDSNIDLVSVQAKQVVEQLQSRNVPDHIMRHQMKVFDQKLSVSALIRKLKSFAAEVKARDHQGDADVQPETMVVDDRSGSGASVAQADREKSEEDSFGDIDLGDLNFAETAGLAPDDRGWGK